MSMGRTNDRKPAGASGRGRPDVSVRDQGSEDDVAAGGTVESRLPTVRRLEALGFRAWPAASARYDGSWLVRLTAGHPSRRLNSVNPLDRMDVTDLEGRIARLERRFAAYDRPLTFRQTPLAPPELDAHFDAHGWGREGETLVMSADAQDLPVADALDLLPVQDVGRFVDAAIEVRPRDRASKSGLTELVNAITPAKGLFVLAEGDAALATALCVHDGDHAGLFEVAVHADARGRSLGRRIAAAALKWAVSRGAGKCWLQVEADNAPALALYAGLGFQETYRYHYRAAPGGDGLDPAEELV